MRLITVALLLVLLALPAFSSIVMALTSDNITAIPSWVRGRYRAGYAGYSSSGSFDGFVTVNYDLLDYEARDFNYDNVTDETIFNLYGKLVAQNYGGYVSRVNNYPFIYTKITLQGFLHVNTTMPVTRADGTNDTILTVVDDKRVVSSTIFTLYHPNDNANLLARLVVMYKEENYAFLFLYWYRVEVDPYTGDLIVDTLDVVTSGVTLTDPGPLTVEMWIRPEWYSLTVSDNSTNTTYLIYGYKGYVRLYVNNVPEGEGQFAFAWDNVRLGPKENVTEYDVREFVQQMSGWYIWVGGGLDYYVPGASRVETIPHWDDNETFYYLTTVAGIPGNITGPVEVVDFDYRVNVEVDYFYVEDWYTDPPTLYTLFMSGQLNEYIAPYFTVVPDYNTKYEYAIRSLVPVGLAAVIWGAFWRSRWAGPVFLLTVLGAGAAMKIYGVAELVAGFVALGAAYYLQRYAGAGEESVGGDNNVY